MEGTDKTQHQDPWGPPHKKTLMALNFPASVLTDILQKCTLSAKRHFYPAYWEDCAQSQWKQKLGSYDRWHYSPCDTKSWCFNSAVLSSVLQLHTHTSLHLNIWKQNHRRHCDLNDFIVILSLGELLAVFTEPLSPDIYLLLLSSKQTGVTNRTIRRVKP